MPLFSFHLAETSVAAALKAMLRPLTPDRAPGLGHAECMAVMELGSGIFSPKRMQLGHLAVFASWDSEQALDTFLTDDPLGRTLGEGWHVRLEFLRRWGRVTEFDDLPQAREVDAESPVVAVTLARLKLPEVPRFIHWGRPVERLVRDHPGATLALAAIRPPRTVSTFSVWRSQREMMEMVRGQSQIPDPERHAAAMVERKRRDFHSEFTTLRFQALSEHGAWKGRTDIVPTGSSA